MENDQPWFAQLGYTLDTLFMQKKVDPEVFAFLSGVIDALACDEESPPDDGSIGRHYQSGYSLAHAWDNRRNYDGAMEMLDQRAAERRKAEL